MAYSDLRRVTLSASGASPLWRLRLAAPYAAKGSPLQQNFPVRVLATGGSQVLRAMPSETAFADGLTREAAFEVPLALWLRAGRVDGPEQDDDRAALKLELDGCSTAFGSESFSLEGQPVVLARPRASAEGWPAPAFEPGEQARREPVVRLPELEAIECELVLQVKPNSPLARALGECGGKQSGHPTCIRLQPGSMVLDGIRLALPDGIADVKSPTVSVEIRTGPGSGRATGSKMRARIVTSGPAEAAPPVTLALWKRVRDVVESAASGTQGSVFPGGVSVAAADGLRVPAFGWRVLWIGGSVLKRVDPAGSVFWIPGDALLIRLLGNSGNARMVVPECIVDFRTDRLILSSANEPETPRGTSSELAFRWSAGSASTFSLAAVAPDGSQALLPLGYDPYRLAGKIRGWLGSQPPAAGKGEGEGRRPASEPKAGAIQPDPAAGSAAESLYAFQPLDRGWLQWPLPNLDVAPPPNDALELPQQADPPSVLRGQWRMALAATGAEAIPRALFVEHAGSVSFSLEFASSANSWRWVACSATLREVRGECTGQCWFGTGRPDEFDALPTTASGAMAFESLPLAFGGSASDPGVPGCPTMWASPLSIAQGPDSSGQVEWIFGPFELHVQFTQPPSSWRPPLRCPPPLSWPPLAWLRHPRVPLVAEMPMTRSADEATDPLRSRDLAPFELKPDPLPPASAAGRDESDPNLRLTMKWPQGGGVSGNPWPSLGDTGVVLDPLSDWPWPSAAPAEDADARGPLGQAIGFASVGAPGVVVAPWRGWETLLDAYRIDIPLLDELFARAALPPTTEEGNGADRDLDVGKAAFANAATASGLRAFWHEQGGRQALTRVQHSYAVTYAERVADALRFECNVVVPRRREVPFATLSDAPLSLGGVRIGDWIPATSNLALAGFSGILKLGDGPNAPGVPVLGWAAQGWNSLVEGTIWTWDLRGLGSSGWLVVGDAASRRAMRLHRTGLLQCPGGVHETLALQPGTRHARGTTVKPVSLELPGGLAWQLSFTGLPLEEREGTWSWDGALASKVAGEGWLGVDVDALEREHVGHAEWVFELAPGPEANQGSTPLQRNPDDDLLAIGGLWFEPLRVVSARASVQEGGLFACDIVGRLFLSRTDRNDRMPAPLCQLSFAGLAGDAALKLAGLAPATIQRERAVAARVVLDPAARLSWPLRADLSIGSATQSAVPVQLSARPEQQAQRGTELPQMLDVQASLLLCGRERILDLGKHPWPLQGDWTFDNKWEVARAGDETAAAGDGRLQGSLRFLSAALAQNGGQAGATQSSRRVLRLGAELELRTSDGDVPCLRWSASTDAATQVRLEAMTWLSTSLVVDKLAFDHLRGTVWFRVQNETKFEVCDGLAIDHAKVTGGGVFVLGGARGDVPPQNGGVPLPVRAGHVELLARRLEQHGKQQQAPAGDEGLALDCVYLQGVIDAQVGATPPHALRLWGRCNGFSAIAWPSVDIARAGPGNPTALGTRLVRRREGHEPLVHRIGFDLRGVRMPLGALAKHGEDGPRLWLRKPWEMTVAVRHELTWPAAGNDGGAGAPCLALVGLQAVAVCSTAAWRDPEPPAAQGSTFLARYRYDRNPPQHGARPNPDVLHPGIAARAVALQGSEGRAFRQAVAAMDPTSGAAPLAVTGKLLAWVASASGGPAHWLELPFLRVFDGTGPDTEGSAGPLGRRGALTQSGADGMKLADADALVAAPIKSGLAAGSGTALIRESLDQVAIERFVAKQLEGAGALAPSPEPARAVEQFFAEPNGQATLEVGAFWLRSLVTVSALRDAFPTPDATLRPAASAGGPLAPNLRTMDAVAVLPISGRAFIRDAAGATKSSTVPAATAKVRVVNGIAATAAGAPSQQDALLLSCGDRNGESPLETPLGSRESAEANDALDTTISSMLPRLHRRAAYAVRLLRTAGIDGAPSKLDFAGVPLGNDMFSEFILASVEYRPQSLALSASPTRGWPEASSARLAPWRRGPRLGASIPVRAPSSGLAGWTDPIALPNYVGAPQTLETNAASAPDAELVWMVQRRQSAWLSGDLGGLIADTPGWLQPGRLRRRLPAPGAILPPPKVSDAEGDQSRELQAFFPPLLECTTVGARAGVVTIERYELLQALQARSAQRGLLPFDERYPRFGQPASTSAQVVRHVRSPRPGPLPKNSGRRSSDRRLQASAARYDQACRVLAGPSEVLRGVWQLGDKTPPTQTGPGQATPLPSREWTAWLSLIAPAGALVSRTWRGGVTLALEIELVEDSVDGRPLQEPTVLPLAHLTDQVLGRDASAWIQVANARIPMLATAPLLSSPAWSAFGTPGSRCVWKAAATLSLRFDPVQVFKALDALAASDQNVPGMVRLALNIGSPAEEDVTRPPQKIEFPLQVDADVSQPRPAFESVSVLFNDPAYETELRGAPARAVGTVTIDSAAEADKVWEAVLYCDRTRIDQRTGFALMLDVRHRPSAETPKPLYAKHLDETAKLSVQAISRNGASRALMWRSADGRPERYRDIHVGVPLASDLSALMESDGSPAILLPGDQLQFVPDKSAVMDLSADVHQIMRKTVKFEGTSTALRVPIAQRSVIPPPASFLAVLRFAGAGAGASTRVAASATSPLPHRVGCFNLRDDMREGSVRRSVDFRWIVAEPAAALATLRWQAIKFERTGQSWLPEAEAELATCERLLPEGFRPALESKVVAQLRAPSQQDRESWVAAQKAASSNDATPVLDAWRSAVGNWLVEVAERLQGNQLASEAAVELLTGDRTTGWAAGSIGLFLNCTTRNDRETRTPRWHHLYAGLAPDDSWCGAQLVSLGVLSPAPGVGCVVIATLCAPASASGSTETDGAFPRLQQSLGDLCNSIGEVAAGRFDAAAQADDGVTHDPPTLEQRLKDARDAYSAFTQAKTAHGPIAAMLASTAAMRAWAFEVVAALLESNERSNSRLNGEN